MRAVRTRVCGRAARQRAHFAARHRAFTAQLRARRRAVPLQVPLALVLLRPLRPLVLRRGAVIGLALNLVQHGTLEQSASVPRAADDLRRAAPQLRTQPRSQFAAGVTAPQAFRLESHRALLIERVLAGQAVTVRQVATHSTHAIRIERTAAYPRITIALARPQAAAAIATGAGDAPVVPRIDAASRTATIAPLFAATEGTMLPPRELARVTDHVLTQLDRKVLSFRERHGQI